MTEITAAVVGFNWKTRETREESFAGEEVEARARSVAEVLNKSGHWTDWTHVVILRNGGVVKAKAKAKRGWVATAEGATEEIGFAEPGEYKNADAAVHGFEQSISDHFDLYFRATDGTLHSTADESAPDDFP